MSNPNVSHPSHYNSGKIEVIEAIEDWGLGQDYHRANVIKYTARAGKKDPTKEIEDLEKAQWYLERAIELLKAKKEGREVVRPNDMRPAQQALFVSGAMHLDGKWLMFELEDAREVTAFAPASQDVIREMFSHEQNGLIKVFL